MFSREKTLSPSRRNETGRTKCWNSWLLCSLLVLNSDSCYRTYSVEEHFWKIPILFLWKDMFRQCLGLVWKTLLYWETCKGFLTGPNWVRITIKWSVKWTGMKFIAFRRSFRNFYEFCRTHWCLLSFVLHANTLLECKWTE